MKLFAIVDNNTKEIIRKSGYGSSKLRIYTSENRAKAALKEIQEYSKEKIDAIIIEYAPLSYE